MTDTKGLTVQSNHVPAELPESKLLPIVIAKAGRASRNAWEDFFGTIQNRHTRSAYEYAVRKFMAWLPRDLAPEQIRPAMVGRYFSEHTGSIPTQKLHLAAIRAFFDLLVERHIVLINPAASVRAPRYVAVEGKTPEIGVESARKLLGSIVVERPDASGNSSPLLVGLRDRAIIATLIYTAARAGAVARLRIKDFRYDGSQWALLFAEKGGKFREIPVRHDLQRFLLAYLSQISNWQTRSSEPLFRTASGKTNSLTELQVTNVDICRMLKRRFRDTGLPTYLSCHSFRVTTITDLLSQGVPLEDVQYLAGHVDPRTTRLYDRRQRRVSRNIVERISI